MSLTRILPVLGCVGGGRLIWRPETILVAFKFNDRPEKERDCVDFFMVEGTGDPYGFVRNSMLLSYASIDHFFP
jgi:hypothetical protein